MVRVAATRGYVSAVQWARVRHMRVGDAYLAAAEHRQAEVLQYMCDVLEPPVQTPVALVIQQYHAMHRVAVHKQRKHPLELMHDGGDDDEAQSGRSVARGLPGAAQRAIRGAAIPGGAGGAGLAQGLPSAAHAVR
jgi:hypothetical protein